MADPTPTPRPQHAFGRTPVQMDISTSNGTITVPELVKLSNEILARARQSGLVPGRAADLEQFNSLYETLWGRYADFAKEFPIIFRWIVYYFDFDEVAFRTYLSKSHEAVWKDKLHMLMAQVDYLVFLRRRRLPNEGSKQLEEYRKYIKKHLETEHETFEKAAKEAEEVHKKNEADRTRRIRESLRDIAARVAATDKCAPSNAEPPDADPSDADPSNADPPDAAPPDAAPPDAAPPDADPPNAARCKTDHCRKSNSC